MPDPQRQSVSSSQAAALFDVSPYYTKFMLWQHFRNGLELDPTWNERIDWGIRLQSQILDATARTYRLEVTENTANEYVRAGPVGATIDGLMYAADVGPVLVEAKNIDFFMWKDTWTRTAASRHVEIQVQIGMKAVEAKVAMPCRKAVIAVLIGGNDLRFYERERNDEMLAAIDVAAQEFLDSVRDDRAPPPFGDAKELATLAQLYPAAVPLKEIEDFADLQVAYDLRMYRDAHEQAGSYDRLAKQLKAKILGRMGDAAILRANGWDCQRADSFVAAGVCEPHTETKVIRKAHTRIELRVTKGQEVELEPPENGPEFMG